MISFIRIVTNPRIYADPAPAVEALGFVQVLRGTRRARRLARTETTWRCFDRLVHDDSLVRGNLVPDAWLAALAIANGCRLATADRGVAHFEGLQWFTPVA